MSALALETESLRTMRFGRVENIKKEIVSLAPAICVHRARLVTEAYRECEAEPVVTRRAHAVDRVLRQMPIYLEKGQLLAGNQAFRPRAAPIFPEYSVSWIEEELGTLHVRSGDKFESTPEDREQLKSIIKYWKGRTLQDRAKSLQPPEVLKATTMSVIEWEGNVTAGEGHITVDYETLVRIGLSGYRAAVEARLRVLDLSDPENLLKRKYYEAAIMTLEAVTTFIDRYAELAGELEEKEEDPERRAELRRLSDVCAKVSRCVPTSFYEALQLVWFVHLILQIESNGHSFSMGRIDQYLYSFYRSDVSKGILSDANALELIECFYLKMFTINKIRSYSHTLVVSGYPTYQNICVGGQTREGHDATNELSCLFLEALAAVRLSEPNFYIRFHENIDERFLVRAAEIVRMGFGMPAFVNDKVIIPSLLNRGVSLEDAMNYSTMGCLEVSVPGKWGYRANGKIKLNLLKILELTLNGGKDPLSHLSLNESAQELGTFESFDALMEEWRRQIAFYTRLHVIADNINSLATEQMTPDVFCSVLIQDCIGRGKLICEGGAIYDMQSGSQIGLANVGNSLAAMKRIVFEERLCSQEDLRKALETDFCTKEGKKIQDVLMFRAPKYGNDDDFVDSLTKAAYDVYCQEIEKHKNTRYGRGPRGGGWFPATVTISSNIPAGKNVGATPDGRKAHTPTADGCSPAHNTEMKGPTAVIRSVDKLSTILVTGGNLLNCRLVPSTIQGEEGLRRLVALVKTHFRLYGWHVQFNTVSTEVLRDAQKNPQNYGDLTVRVAGYSALFVALDKDVQNDIIDRMAYKLS